MGARISSNPSPEWAQLGRITLFVLPFLLASCSDSSSPANNMNSSNGRTYAGRLGHRSTISDSGATEPAEIELFAPDDGDRAGTEGEEGSGIYYWFYLKDFVESK